MATPRISRRATLRGLGAALSLPLLEAMLPSSFSAVSNAKQPVRMAFLYVPNGKHMPDWLPTQEGRGYELPKTLKPLEHLREDFNILTGLTHQKAYANGDGGGDHARALTTFLTGRQAKKTDGADIRAGVSVDQVAARELGKQTRFASLEVGAEAGAQSGNCDSGYSCAYSSSIAWFDETQPVSKEVDPKLIFERLFTVGREGESQEARQKRLRYNQSILDLVQEDANRLRNRVGVADQRKLDQYLTAVRELEVRISKSQSDVQLDGLSMQKPSGIPESYAEHLRLLLDLIALAFQTDTTRVATMIFANEGSNRNYDFLGIPEGHHDLSHHEDKAEKQAKIQRINEFHVSQLAYFLERLKSLGEGEGSVLDNSLILYGSGIADGNSHAHTNLPILLAGRGGGVVRPGRHIAYREGTPLTNLYLSMLDGVGVRMEHLGDSTGQLDGLSAS